jgi:hypothetical protein
VRRFQLHLIESGASICNRNRIMTGVRFLFRVTLRRHDLAAEVWHLKEPQKLPPVLSPEEVKRVLTMATSLKARAMLTLAYGCGLRAGRVKPHRLPAAWAVDALGRPPKCLPHLATSHARRHPHAVALASRPQSTSTLISNPHSARC